MCLHEVNVVTIASLPEGHAGEDIMDQRSIPPLLLAVHSNGSSAADLLHF